VSALPDVIALAQDAVRPVIDDLTRTTPLRPEIRVDTFKGGLRISYNGDYCTGGMYLTELPEAVAEVGDYLQEYIMEDLMMVWPVCGVHSVGAHSEVHDGAAVWWCRTGSHAVAAVGSLRT
jgi:hypothetical protein